ncbi:MAG: phosphoribosylanthranilate isomerase [Candidatus Omnitrophica bacterium]|nr:phosphoribosylanthranilate isomerase [Candidatus Omnitrophota bacterium]
MVKVKICGITNLGDALMSVGSGCDALGFVFYKKSPRYISPKAASVIIRNLPKDTVKIGVFVDTPEKRIKNIARFCKLDILQFHGHESAQFCRKFKGYKIIKSFRIKNRIDLQHISEYKTFAWLFDTFVRAKMGGTGKRFDWRLLRRMNKLNKPVFLSGGLNAANVKKAIKTVQPDWVDVSSSVEIKPGKKEPAEVRRFIKAAKPVRRK